MKAKTLILILVVAVASAAVTWFIALESGAPKTETGNGRKILYYQSAMHPWIKSDKPGKCTVCGMDLVPVYEGERGFDSAAGVISLSSNSINVINVQTVEVKKRPLMRTLRVAGTIEEDETRHRVLAAYVDGRVDKLFVNYVGAEVKQGEPLALIYSPMLLAAEREYLSLAKQDSISESLKREHEQLVRAAAQRLKLLGLSDGQITALREKGEVIDHTEILAPISGTVVSRDVYEGKYVMTGEKLFELADFNTMWFKADVYENDLAWLAPGQEVEITTPSVPGTIFKSKIAFIDPNLNDPTRSAKVRVEIPNPLITTNGVTRRVLFHRLYADASVRVESPEVLTVARSAVLSPGGSPVVFVDKGGGAYEQRAVKLGRAGDEFWEVTDGLSEGERVVTTGNLLIDSQAQLAASANAGEESPAETHEHLPALSANQKAAASDLLKLAGTMADALASDDLASFNSAAAQINSAAATLTKSLTNADGWLAFAQQIERNAHIPKANDLADARKAFLPLSLATVELAKRLKANETDFASLRIFKCPMTNQAVPDAPKDGFWIQTNVPLRNPFFGSEMLDCGTEVK